MRVENWPYTNEPMTPAFIRQTYGAASFRIAEHKYPPGTTFPGRTRAAKWFVLAGACTVRRDEEVTVKAGQVAEIDAGDYTMTVVGDTELHLMEVWDLRPFMN
ncbi:hypothetical protein WMF28_38430 [Sorangium sp. So ce590]|uniref:cupin domain-containing protein n=1 Tax=Sorangium sp. So ce590 TaxID=3133317 RepID=UPI003F60AAC7